MARQKRAERRKKTEGAGSLFDFQWKRDPAGYTISHGKIRRNGGRLETYTPAIEDQAPHFAFMESTFTRDETGEETDEGVLAFVSRYGFLHDADGDSEPLHSFHLARTNMSIVRDFVVEDRDMDPTMVMEAFNRFAKIDATVKLQPAGGGQARLSIVPRRLIDWLWLQYANQVAGGDYIGRCEYCGKPFRVSRHQSDSLADGNASTVRRRFCSASHRASWNRREKQRKAKEDRERRTMRAKARPKK